MRADERVTIACVNQGDYLGRGEDYVQRLQSMVSRHLRRPFDFVCITEAHGLTGWWTKIALFEPGRFSGRVLYTDLDSVIVGDLEPLVANKGIVDLADWGWKTHTLCSCVMVWDAGEHAEIFEKFTPEVPQQFRGDQDWITHLGGWEVLPPQLCRSYRYHSRQQPPEGCVHVSFHGTPKPHHVVDGWVPKHWQ